MTAPTRIPIALTIAGSDPSGGAGIQADLKTFSALRVYGAAVITALTAQNTRTVRAIHDPPLDFILAQLDTVLADVVVDAVKVGMLSRPEAITVVARRLRAWPTLPLVLDPVMVAKSGAPLLRPEAAAALRQELMPLARVVTPNLPEAAVLLGERQEAVLEHREEACRRILQLGARAVVLKGGHAGGPESEDLLMGEGVDGLVRLTAPRVATKNTHGTGCTFAAAITAGLAQGLGLTDAVKQAKRYITGAILAADQLKVGQGHGPVHHFFDLWK